MQRQCQTELSPLHQYLWHNLQATALQDEDEREEGNEQLAGALCALAERLLGNAEKLDTVAPECEQLLERAHKIFPDSPEPIQVVFAS